MIRMFRRAAAAIGSLATLLVFASPAMAQPAPVTVQDLRGQTITFAKPPERIVTIPIPAASMVMGLDGGAGRLVGMNPTALTAIRGEWLGSVYPASLGVNVEIVRGGQFVPNIETLLALKPDVVFQWADQGPAITEPIERAGLKLFGQRYGTQAYLEQTITAMGTMLGQDAKAQDLIRRHHAVRAKVQAAMAGLSEAERPRAIYFGRFVQSLRPHGAGSYQVESFERAGARNAVTGVTGTGTDVTFEQVLAWAPQVIFLGAFDEAKPDDLYKDPKWATVPAVRDRRVYKLPTGGYRWDPPNLESPLTWMWLATLLHPERVSFDLRREMDELLALIYGRAPTDAEARRILRIAENAGSRHYERIGR
jgi:iron complex transport system substrate-binding protein